MILVKGRPDDCSGRLEKEIRVYDLLDRLGINYHRVDHETLFTMEACEAVDRILDCAICKNLFLSNRKGTKFFLLMIVGEKKYNAREIADQIGSARLSFAKAEYMEELLDITPGSMSVFGLMNDNKKKVQLLVDEELFENEYVGAHPCINTSSLRIKTEDVFGPILDEMGHDYIKVHVS